MPRNNGVQVSGGSAGAETAGFFGFLNKEIKVTSDKSLAMSTVLLALLAAVFFFGTSWMSGLLSPQGIRIISAIIAGTVSYLLLKNGGLFGALWDVVSWAILFIILMYVITVTFPQKVNTTDVSNIQAMFPGLGTTDGYVDVTGAPTSFGVGGATVTFGAPSDGGYAPPSPAAAAVAAAAAAPPVAAAPPAAVAPPVVTLTQQQIDARAVYSAQTEIGRLMDTGEYQSAYTLASETSATYGDDYSRRMMTVMETAESRDRERLAGLSFATSASHPVTKTPTGEASTVALLAGDEWLVLGKVDDFGIWPCQDNVVIEQQGGIGDGAQYKVKYCLLNQFPGNGKVGTSFTVSAQR